MNTFFDVAVTGIMWLALWEMTRYLLGRTCS